MKLNVQDIKGKDTGKKIELSTTIFGIEPHNHAIYLDVKRYLAHQRQGTSKVKERSEVVGSTRKIKKQKGTGTARAGSIKNPLFVGGGRIFGPKPRDYKQKINKNVKRLARKSALSLKAKEKSIQIIEDFNFSVPKTKEYVSVLKALKIDSKKSILVFEGKNNNVYLASRNLKNSEVITLSELNTYKILYANNIVFSESALLRLEEVLS